MDAMSRGVIDVVRPLAAEAVRAEGAELVDMEYRREPAGWVLRLFVDKAGGVNLADCQRISEVVGTLLEVEDPIPYAYTLEVSSPGLTRPLRTEEEFRRCAGSLVKVVTRQPVAGSQSLTGRLLEAQEGILSLEIEGRTVEISLDLVARARLELEWPAAAGRKGTKKAGGRGGRRAGRTEQDSGHDGK